MPQTTDEKLKELGAIEKSNSENYDKAILGISAAAFALTLAFLKDLGPGASLVAKFVLTFCWVFLFLSLGCLLYSYSLTGELLKLMRKDQLHKSHESFPPLSHLEQSREVNLEQSVDCLNSAAGIFLILGLLLGMIFGLIHIFGGGK